MLDPTSFKAALLRSGAGLNRNDLNRLTRYIEKNSNFQIDYVRFVDIIEKTKSEDDIKLIATKFSYNQLDQFSLIKEIFYYYITESKIHPPKLLRKLSEKKNKEITNGRATNIEDFAEFLFEISQPFVKNKENCKVFASKIDINNDALIDETDLTTFLNRIGYIAEAEKEIVKTNSLKNVSTNQELFPKAPLSEKKIVEVLRDLRQALENKGISNHDFVRRLDVNEVGFITISDFCKELDKIIKFSQPIKDGFFAYIDKRKIGMVDYDEIINMLKRSIINTPVVKFLLLFLDYFFRN